MGRLCSSLLSFPTFLLPKNLPPKNVSQSLILSLFDYADVVYAPALSQQLLNRIYSIQNSCLRFFYCIYKYDHIFFVSKFWMTKPSFFCSTYVLFFLLFCFSNTLFYLRSFLHLNSEFYSSNTSVTYYRSPILSFIPYTSKFRTTFSYTAVKYFTNSFIKSSYKISLGIYVIVAATKCER